MQRLKRFLNLTSEERRLLYCTFFFLGLARVMLWTLPLALVRQMMRAASILAFRQPIPIGRLPWAVSIASRWVPRATCLPQALAVQAVLRSAGQDSRLEFGIAKDSSNGFEAHAWVISGNRIMIGGPDVERYVRLSN